jgi:PKD repeat protein
VLHGAGYIGDTGSASIPLTPFGSEGIADIVVTCQFKIPYTSTISITGASEPPTADFTGSPTSGMVALTVQFTDQSIGATSWSWDFGDTGTSTDRNPSHTYTSPGTYTVSLTATNSYGSDTETKINYITVTALQPPVADFTASSTNITVGDSVTFTDNSTNNPTSWSWTFNGGTPSGSTDQNPTITYNTPGTYTVSLTAGNAAGSDTETKVDYINVADKPYCASQGNNWSYEYIGNVTVGSFSNDSGAAGYTDFTHLTIDLTAGDTVNVSLTPVFPSSTYTEYWKIWIDYNGDHDFEDDGEEVFSDVSTTTVTGSFTVQSGVNIVTRMRVSMKWNGWQTPCETFSYGEVEDYTVDISGGIIDPPVADFSASATTITVGQSVTFTDLSTNNPTSWSWTFDGGTPSSSTSQNPTITYNTAGTYTVSLTATNSAGSDTETKAGYITVNPPPPPVADFTASATTVTEGQNVTFTDTSTNNPTSWSWTFEGGTPATSTDQNPTVTYNTEGTYDVTLTATNAGGSDDEIKPDYITVNPPGGLTFETGTVSNVGSSWQTVNLTNTYSSMVVVCSTGLLNSSTLPAVTRVRNASGNSFDVMVQNPSGSALSGYTVHYFVVEEGVYTEAADGVKMEAVKFTSTVTAENNNWATESHSFQNSYTTPVVLGQVMTYNDADWSVFWANGSARGNPPSASAFNAGKNVGEDPDATRANETVGYVVFEQGSGTINSTPFTAAVGADSVRGPDNTSTGFTYTFSSVPNADVAIISAAGMDGGNGGWPVMYGSTPLTTTSLTMVFDEDQVNDSERKHTTEQVAYIVFGQ